MGHIDEKELNIPPSKWKVLKRDSISTLKVIASAFLRINGSSRDENARIFFLGPHASSNIEREKRNIESAITKLKSNKDMINHEIEGIDIVGEKNSIDQKYIDELGFLTDRLIRLEEDIGRITEKYQSIDGTLNILRDANENVRHANETAEELSKAFQDVEKNKLKLTTLIDFAADAGKKIEKQYSIDNQKLEEVPVKLDEALGRLSEATSAMDTFVEENREKNEQASKILAEMQDKQGVHSNMTLSKIFRDNASRVENTLFLVEIKMWFATFLLFISAIPLIIFVSMPLIEILAGDASVENIERRIYGLGNVWEFLANVVSRIGIMIPAGWLFLSWNKRYNLLLQLREHYQYKDAIAVSIEGLKTQSKVYSDQIIAKLVGELASDPAKIMSRNRSSADVDPSPWDRLLHFDTRRASGDGDSKDD